MTCIAGLVQDGAVWIAGDSAGANSGWDITVRADQKVWVRDPFIFGFTTSFRMGQLLRYRLTLPERAEGQEVEEFMVGPFIDSVRTCLKDGGYAKKTSEQEEAGTFLVGYAGRLFAVHDDYQVGEAVDGFDAVGCGAAAARGALVATENERDPQHRLDVVMRAAERCSAGVRGPFTVAVLNPPAIAERLAS